MANQRRNEIMLKFGLDTSKIREGIENAKKRIQEFSKWSEKKLTGVTRGQGRYADFGRRGMGNRSGFLSAEEQRVQGIRIARGNQGNMLQNAAFKAYLRIFANLRRDARATRLAFRRLGRRIRTFGRNIRRALSPMGILRNSFRALRASARATSAAFLRFNKVLRRFGGLVRGLSNARFILGSVVTALAGVQFARLAGEISNAEVSFRSIVRTIGSDPGKALEGFRKSLKGTASDLEIARQVATASIFDIAENAIDLQKIFDTARRLGRATGRSTGEAIRDISLGIGRQSRLILDNIGLIVRVQRANEVYADSVGKTVEQLTDLEKKFAFQKAALDAADVAVQRLGEDYDTFNDILLQFRTNLANAAATAAKTVTPVLRKVLEDFNKVDFERLGKTIAQFAAGGLEVLAQKSGNIADQFTRIADALGQLLFNLSAGAGTILESFVSRLEVIARNPAKEIPRLLGDVAGVFATIFVELFKRIFSVDTLAKISDFVIELFRQIIGEIFVTIGNLDLGMLGGVAFGDIGEKLSKRVKDAGNEAGGFLSKVGDAALRVVGTTTRELSQKIALLKAIAGGRIDPTENLQTDAELSAAAKTADLFTESLGDAEATIENFRRAAEDSNTPLSTLNQTFGRLISDSKVTLDTPELKELSDRMITLSQQSLNAEQQFRRFQRVLGQEGSEIELDKLLVQAGLQGQGFFERILGEDPEDSKRAIEEVNDVLKKQIRESTLFLDLLADQITKKFGNVGTAVGTMLNIGDFIRFRALASAAEKDDAEIARQTAEDLVKANSNKTKFENISVTLNKSIAGLKAEIAAADSQSNNALKSIIAQKVQEARIEAARLKLSEDVTADFVRRTELQQTLLAKQKLIGDFRAVRDSLTGGIAGGIIAGLQAAEDQGKAFAQSVGNALKSNLQSVLKDNFDDLLSGLTDGILDIIKKIDIESGEQLMKMSKAILGIIGLILSTQKETSVSEISEDQIQASSSAVRGVIAGPQNVAIAEIGDSIAEANRGTESLLGDILDVLEDIRGNNLTSGGIGAAGTI